MRRWLRRVRQALPLGLREQDLEDEFRLHLECRAEEWIRAGLPPAEAWRRARLEFGAVERVKEQCRDARAGVTLRALVGDLRFAWRQTIRDGALSLTIVTTIALAIGVTTTVFSVVHAVVLDPVPYPAHERVVFLWATNERVGVTLEQARRTGSSIRAGEFAAWRDQSGVFGAFAAVAVTNAAHLGGPARITFADADANAEPAQVALVSPEFFEVTRVFPRIGRPFGDLRRGMSSAADARAEVIVQDGYWRRRLEGRAEIVGATVWQDYGAGPEWSRELRVVGIMPRDFTIISRAVDYLQPFADFDDYAARSPEARGVVAIGRLKDGLSLAEAQRRAEQFARILDERGPARLRGWKVQLVPAAQEAAGEFRPFMLALFAALLLLVVVLAANTATLLLLRLSVRAREIGLRCALGASTGRLVRQFVTESTALALVGAGAGFLVAYGLLGWLRLTLPHPKTWGGSFLEAEALRLDWTAVLFAFGAAVAVGGAFGLLPAWHASRTSVVESLKDGGPGVTDAPRRRRISLALIAAQVVLASVLVTGGGLLARSVSAVREMGPGFEHRSRLAAGVRLTDGRITRELAANGRTPQEARKLLQAGEEPYWRAKEQLRRTLLEKVASLPGVAGVTSATEIPMTGKYWLGSFRANGPSAAGGTECTQALFTSVDDNYFAEMRIPVLQGRAFDRTDGGDSAPVVIVSAEVAQRCWPGESPIGRHLWKDKHPHVSWFTVVGVVGDTRLDGAQKSPVPHVYEPWSQNRWWWGGTTLILRSAGDPMSLAMPLRREVAALDPDGYLLRAHRLSDLVRDSNWRMNYAAGLSLGLAVVSLLLAAVGIYGVLGHLVSERTREIGMRMALGARATHLVAFVVRHAFAAVALGLALGLAISAAVVQWLRALLFAIQPLDIPTFVAAALVLVAIAMTAAALPLRRALGLDPIAALRRE